VNVSLGYLPSYIRVHVLSRHTSRVLDDLGAEGGDAGGHVVAVGTPEAMRPALGLDPRVAASPASYTGQYVEQIFERRRKPKRTAQAAE